MKIHRGARRAVSAAAILTAGVATSAIAAVDEPAMYRLTFESGWMDVDVPNEHFSPLIGGTHDDSISFWMPGGLATPGIELMAETGGTSTLRTEVQVAIFGGGAGALIEGPGIDSPGDGTTTFTLTPEHPLASVVTMIAPSPDWFVGVNGLDLRTPDGEDWRHDVVFELRPWDAGTDSGTTFVTPNIDTNPPEPITMIVDPGLFDPLVLGTFHFQRLVDCDEDGTFDIDQIAVDPSLDLDGDGLLDACTAACVADVTGDDAVVDFNDLLALLAGWGADGPAAVIAAPMDVVDFDDLLGLLAAWGPCPG